MAPSMPTAVRNPAMGCPAVGIARNTSISCLGIARRPSQISAEGAQFLGWRNTVMPDQEGHLLERQGLRNIMDIVAAKGKLGDRPVDVSNTRLAGQYTFEPGNHLLGCLAHNAPRVLCRWFLCVLCGVGRGDSCRFSARCQETTGCCGSCARLNGTIAALQPRLLGPMEISGLD